MKTSLNFCKTIFVLSIILISSHLAAQAPNAMSYQAVMRNASNVLISNATVGVRISIIKTSPTGTVVFSEYHSPTTNLNGLATLTIGNGTILTGNLSTINWASGPYFIKTETDPSGGTNYTISGTTQLVSVPFALFAANATTNWTTTGTNIANNNTGNVGVGTGLTVPSSLLTVKTDAIGFTQEDATGASKIGFYTSATSAFIQTHSNNDLLFSTNNGTAQMVLQKATGNLGIGIAPTEKLDVAGKTKTTNLQVTSGSALNNLLVSDALGNATWQNPNTALNSFAWKTTGNSGTSPVTNFVGTTDDTDLVFKRNSSDAGRISTANSAFGVGALNPLSTGLYNAAYGSYAMDVNTTGGFNTSIGYYSMKNNTTGFSNTATGYGSLRNNSVGNNNTATGAGALFANVDGYKNVAVGVDTLGNNTLGSENVAVGNSALGGTTSASGNTALGNEALKIANSDGNTAVGSKALWKDTTGNLNVAIGNSAMLNTTVGYENVAVGFSSLFNLVGGVNNVAIGTSVGSNIINGSNNTIIGNGAVTPSGGDNQVRIGNTAVTYAGIQVAWSITSDKRWKNNIQPSNLGLNFIKKLNPVSYFRNNDASKKLEYGFIAQELEETLNNSNASNNGIITKSDDGMYSVRYNDLLSPIVKAIQELEIENQNLKKQNNNLEKRLKAIEDKLSR